MIFGVFGEALMDGPGGVFFGLIKDTNKRIRPSFLRQTGYTSFTIDLRHNQPQLVLSKESLVPGEPNDYIPMTRELNRRCKVPVVHYAARPTSFVVNGLPLQLSKSHPALVIFDTLFD